MNIEKIKVPNNWICVQSDDSNEYVTIGKEKIKLDISFAPEQHSQTVGKVVKVCDNIHFSKKFHPSHPWDVPVEIQEGDTVIFHFLALKNAKGEGKTFTENGVRYSFIPYSEVFCALRGDEVHPVNGWILVEPFEKELPKTSIILTELSKGKSEERGVVRYAGAKVMGYKDHPQLGEDPEVNIGDSVVFSKLDSIPLQYELHNKLGKLLYRMQRKDVLAILEGANG
jgi:co-chaperonin GroES (HSP10)